MFIHTYNIWTIIFVECGLSHVYVTFRAISDRIVIKIVKTVQNCIENKSYSQLFKKSGYT